jgi:tRNA-Thr(GGU) m(6)t(6)A37 methyltransferase TsaA
VNIQLTAIGIIHSRYSRPAGTPIQPVFSEEGSGRVEIYPEYRTGLTDLEGFSHIYLIYFLHLVEGFSLTCKPFLDTQERGIFATRAPCRPNPIGISVVELKSLHDGVLTVGQLDIVDGTPLLDIKPYVPEFDVRQQVKTGWYEKAGNKQQTMADDRFVSKEGHE